MICLGLARPEFPFCSIYISRVKINSLTPRTGSWTLLLLQLSLRSNKRGGAKRAFKIICFSFFPTQSGQQTGHETIFKLFH